MHLTMHQYPVQSITWGNSTEYNAGQLSISRADLLAYLHNQGELNEIEIKELALVSPATSTRVINIFDIFPAQARLGKGAINYPGVLGPIQPVGNGTVATLENFAVLAISSRTNKYHKLLDMAGPGSELTPHAGFFHLAVCADPIRSEMTEAQYHGCLKRIGLRIGSYLAGSVSAPPVSIANYSLDPHSRGLPRVAYVCMIASHQKSAAGEPILYGDDQSGLLTTILNPNEILYGSLVSPYWNLGIDTYTFQKNPVVRGLYDRHGKDVDFVGVVVCVAHITRTQRERSVLMISNLVHSVLGADLALISKVGGGIPESDLMMSIEALEQRGVRTSAIVWSHLGDGSIKDSLSATSVAADAIASAGVYDDWVDLPQQAEIVGGSTVGPFSDDPQEKPQPATAAIRVRYRDISGCISQLGASRVAQVEI